MQRVAHSVHSTIPLKGSCSCKRQNPTCRKTSHRPAGIFPDSSASSTFKQHLITSSLPRELNGQRQNSLPHQQTKNTPGPPSGNAQAMEDCCQSRRHEDEPLDAALLPTRYRRLTTCLAATHEGGTREATDACLDNASSIACSPSFAVARDADSLSSLQPTGKTPGRIVMR